MTTVWHGRRWAVSWNHQAISSRTRKNGRVSQVSPSTAAGSLRAWAVARVHISTRLVTFAGRSTRHRPGDACRTTAISAGWKHLAAVRRGDRLELYVDGRREATSSTFNPADYDVGNDCPLRIGFGELDYFSGKIREVRLYQRALETDEIAGLATEEVR